MSQPKQKAAKFVVPTAVAAAVAAVALSITWSSGLQAESHQEQTPGSAPQQKVTGATESEGDDPTTWRLPIEAYLPGPSQGMTGFATSTRDERIDECMAAAGFADWEPAPDLPSLGSGGSLTADRYGIHDLEQARKGGYHPDPDKVKAYNEALTEDHSMETDREVLRECAIKVDGRPRESLDVAQEPTLAEEIAWYSYRDSKSDPAALSVFKQWSTCMKAKGYEYEAPMDANDDPRWAAAGGLTQQEIDTAVADVECRDRHHVEKAWFDAETTIQRSYISKNLKALEQEQTSRR
jgi:hypothetical protein